MYSFNLLVSYQHSFACARKEVLQLLKSLGDERCEIRRTLARGIMGVRTSLDARKIVYFVRQKFKQDPLSFQFAIKWVPIDRWTTSDVESVKRVVEELKAGIGTDERWRVTVEKRRLTSYHKIGLIKEVAGLIDSKVDLEKPEKILRIDVLGKFAGVSILRPGEWFSTHEMP